MKARKSMAVALVAIAGGLWCACAGAVEILKEEPPKGTIAYRKIVCVDDGTCPKGEVKEITGGDSRRNIPREVRCVKRPE